MQKVLSVFNPHINKSALVYGALVSIVLACACYENWDREIAANPPIQKVRFLGNREIFITSAPGIPLGDLLDLKIFGEFWPKINFDEAIKTFGQPDDILLERRSDTYYVYYTHEGQIEIVKRKLSSEGREWVSWVLRMTPQQMKTSDLLSPVVITYIPESEDLLSVTIIAGEAGESRARVDIKSGAIARILWLS